MAEKLQKPNTIEITNFSGRLTRTKNGDINSGFAKFSSSFGYDPFSKPNQLTWLEAPVNIGAGVVTDLITTSQDRFETNTGIIYAIGSTGVLYRIQPNNITNPNFDAVSSVMQLIVGLPDYTRGGSLEFYGNRAYFGSNNKISYKDIVVGTPISNTAENNLGNSSVVSSVYRPQVQFLGKLYLGNGNNLIEIDSTNSITTYARLSPSLPDESNITDLDVSPQGDYMYITAIRMINEDLISVGADRQSASVTQSAVYKWNGIDEGATAVTNFPSVDVTAMQIYLGQSRFFSNDLLGTAIGDGTNKLLTVPNTKSPFSQGTLATGDFLCWIAPEISGSNIVASLFYFGRQDDQSPEGLWRVMRYTSTLSSGFVYQAPWTSVVNNKYSTVNNPITAVVPLGYGKHYFSTYEVNSGHSGTDNYTLQRFLVTPTGTGTPQLGVYETQNQLFSKRISLSEIRVYCEPAATGNGFQLDIIGSNGNPVTNGTFTYAYAAGTDITLLQGAIERINFNPGILDLYSLGIRITNTGITNMVINKIEVDWLESGK